MPHPSDFDRSKPRPTGMGVWISKNKNIGPTVEIDEVTVRSALHAAIPAILAQVNTCIGEATARALDRRRGRVDYHVHGRKEHYVKHTEMRIRLLFARWSKL
jgi:hypothetical protein